MENVTIECGGTTYRVNLETGKVQVAFGSTFYIRKATEEELKIARRKKVESYAN